MKKNNIKKREWTISSALSFLISRGVKQSKSNNHILILPDGVSNTMGGCLDYLHEADGYTWR